MKINYTVEAETVDETAKILDEIRKQQTAMDEITVNVNFVKALPAIDVLTGRKSESVSGKNKDSIQNKKA
ncbi:hypothetical protein M3M38_07265 [Fructilactobacillus cliffordii]|uniref:hypothetical protein n=1 Tax=Fructilactobacillus cliffordii TaxID=2940299 RepID=UPI002092B76B|nr:hypothetical protein [Fructilactobacillus cliffordii]USS86458.1 hypothetical protein M3M38_07265 [Fructilactobacillus cliffordii]